MPSFECLPNELSPTSARLAKESYWYENYSGGHVLAVSHTHEAVFVTRSDPYFGQHFECAARFGIWAQSTCHGRTCNLQCHWAPAMSKPWEATGNIRKHSAGGPYTSDCWLAMDVDPAEITRRGTNWTSKMMKDFLAKAGERPFKHRECAKP